MRTVTGDAAAAACCSSLLLGFRADTGRGAAIVDNVATHASSSRPPLSPIYEIVSPQQDVQTPVVSSF